MIRGWQSCVLVVLSLVLLVAVVHSQTPSSSWFGGHLAAAEALHKAWQGDNANRQCFNFSFRASLARDNFVYPDFATGKRQQARKGDLISLRCDSVVCPNPPVLDCYMNEGICGDDEWCQLEDQVRFGPWAMADNGETPNVSPGDCSFFKEHGYDWIFDQVCRNASHWGPWQSVRGRCAKYRHEGQSCNAYFAAVHPAHEPPASSPHSKRQSTGHRKQQHHQTSKEQLTHKSLTTTPQPDDETTASGPFSTAQLSRMRRLLTPVDTYHSASGSVLQDAMQLPAAAGMTTAVTAGGITQLVPHYVVDESHGRPPVRPQLCGPGLVCTGDVEPLPHTCVKVRPPNTCFQGPWWDSTTWCKVGGKHNNAFYGGLPLTELKEVAKALLIQLPVEHFTSPLNPKFWHSQAADVARSKIQGILAALWPEKYRAATTFPLPIPDPRHTGAVYSAGWNKTAAEAASLYRQANKVWSTVQTLVHNMQDPMPWTQVAASRALAVWLRQHFMCCNCRGMWANYVLNNLALPPQSNSRFDHTRWWWRAQNMVSEHAANSRGGHPWVWQAMPDTEFEAMYAEYGGRLKCQNPWFLPYEFAELMWKIPGH